jgi:hypothetical protein
MKNRTKILTGLLLLFVFCGACAMYKTTLQTQTAGAINPGTYSVIKYGGNYSDDFSTFALIVPDRGQYTFNIYKPDFEYRAVRGVSDKQAISLAQAFVRGNAYFAGSQFNGIIGPAGDVIAYEVRPLYRSTLFGKEDVLLLGYFLKKGNVVEVRIDVDDVVKQRDKGGPGNNE